MKRTILVALGLALLAAGPASAQRCLQDQYGNQYNFTTDDVHQYVYGTVTTNCPTEIWPLVGSYVSGFSGLVLELTGANPDTDPTCVTVFKLKGTYPNFAWYYEFGYGAQESAYVACGTAVLVDATVGGARR